jgi:indolepyruvate ferredoxin oxidoreductase
LTGDHLAANLVLVGAAFQAGLLPFSAEALAGAIRLNGVDVPASLAALDWGRTAVALPETLAEALAPTVHDPPAPPATEVPADLEPDADWPEALRQLVRLRVAELIAFQSTGVARTYLKRVAEVAGTERSASGDPQLSVTASFARGLYALTAVKDEYEVARLHLLEEEQQAFARAFPGARPVYMLKPPLLASLGLQRKIKLARSARPAFHLLRAGRHLRGTPLDPFGWSAERRGERRFHDEYLSWVDIALGHLTPATADAVRAVVDLANDVHGYAHVRRASIARVRAEATRQLAALTGSEELSLTGSPAAG